MNNHMFNQMDREPKEFDERVIDINRISKKTKGGNTIRFAALVVIGDGKGRVGAGVQKASDVRSAIAKAINYAKKHLVTVPLAGTTLPYNVEHKFSAAKVMLKPAPPGSGIIAGGPVRIVLEVAGVRDAVGKVLGSNNKITNVYATIEALEKMTKIQEGRGALK
jgi:small subunit ribosomal protein S5